MSSKSNNWKLGLFVMTGAVAALAAVFWLAANQINRKTLPAVAYFAESVQGLDVGAPVKIRGVTIGNVREITIAPDGMLVEVRSDIFVDRLERMNIYDPNLDFRRWWQAQEALGMETPRVQLASVGITGVKFLQVDFFDSTTYPAPVLGIDIPPNSWYVPTVPSTLKSLEDGAAVLFERLPTLLSEVQQFVSQLNALDLMELSQTATTLIARVDSTLDEVAAGPLSSGARELMTSVGEVATSANHMLEQLDEGGGTVGRLVGRWEAVATKLDTTLERLDKVLVGADEALGKADIGQTVASLRDTSDAYGRLARDASGITSELQADLAALRSTLDGLKSFIDYLERNPSALVRGRETTGSYSKENQ